MRTFARVILCRFVTGANSNTGQPSNREIHRNDGKHRHRARKHYARRDLPTAQINQSARPYLGTIFCLPNYEAMRLPIARRTGRPVVETAPASFPALGCFISPCRSTTNCSFSPPSTAKILPAFLSESGQTVKVTGFKFRSEICLLRHQGAIHDEQARHYGDPGTVAPTSGSGAARGRKPAVRQTSRGPCQRS